MLFMIGLGAMVYLIARAIPRVEEEERSASKPEGAKRVFILTSIERIDRLLGETLEKTLRRVRVLVLKIESAISRSLERKRKFAGESTEKGKQSTTLFESRSEEEQ